MLICDVFFLIVFFRNKSKIDSWIFVEKVVGGLRRKCVERC